MKVIIVSTSDMNGGAARAAYRIFRGLRQQGVEAQMLVQERLSDETHVQGPEGKLGKGLAALRPTLDQLPLWLSGESQRPVSFAWISDGVSRALDAMQPDIIHLNSWNKGFMRIGALRRLKAPIVWTMHDMWPFTGGCHYDHGCGRYIHACGRCPQLESLSELDLSRWTWKRKRSVYRKKSLVLVSPSRWLAQCAEQSSLFHGHPIHVIPNGLDTQRFKPVDRGQARNWLGLPQDKKLVLFSGMNAVKNPLKGFHFLTQSLDYLVEMGWRDRLELVVLGSSQPTQPLDIPIPIHFFGRIQDEISLALINGAVDVLVIPSFMDNFPNTILEALSCGTPVAGFRVGGIPEMVDHQSNGFLADPKDPGGLAYGIDWILSNDLRWNSLTIQARRSVLENYDQKSVAEKYLALYSEVLNRNPGSL